ncbi:hypothetical protein MKZ38_006607 [Zalerion maritima]|uniref:Uncharacterized protein n=1 Tax=Zalerion maritima TaxID=339359 RepID=A0AAD5RNS4_9PEZI|nr:hypothetical protein MKZ38_006607 [Zalerion maritima]
MIESRNITCHRQPPPKILDPLVAALFPLYSLFLPFPHHHRQNRGGTQLFLASSPHRRISSLITTKTVAHPRDSHRADHRWLLRLEAVFFLLRLFPSIGFSLLFSQAMGRPLFVAKVESDLASEKTASYARSPIRRNRRRANNTTVQSPPEAVLSASLPSEGARASSIPAHETLAHLARAIDDNSRPLRESSTRPLRSEDIPTYAQPWDFPLDSSRAERERLRLHAQGRMSQASRVCPDQSPDTSAPAFAANTLLQAQYRSSPPGRRSSTSRLSGRRWYAAPEQASTRRSPSSRFRRTFEEYTSSRGGEGSSNRFDGLGDRDRSLSPEGAHVWDTLLTSITPDPQPPSLGSSFASTAASQSAAGSAATSFTEPDANPEMALGADPGCESGAEDRDTSEAEDDDDLTQAIASGFRRHIPRSHPSSRPPVPPRVPESGNDSMEDMMSRLRELVDRHNVPHSFLQDFEGLRRERLERQSS